MNVSCLLTRKELTHAGQASLANAKQGGAGAFEEAVRRDLPGSRDLNQHERIKAGALTRPS